MYILCILALLTGIFCLAYFLLVIRFCYGWIKTVMPSISSASEVKTAVIIAARNEEKNIAACLDAIIAQSYPEKKQEIIVVDDSSTDATNTIVQQYCSRHQHIRLISLPVNLSGKKEAIKFAIASTQAELIVTTDADCVAGKNWLQSIVSFYDHTKAKMIVAPVCFHDERSVFEKMQSLELMALMGSTGGALYFNNAILCNGANLAYSKKAYEEVNGFEGIDQQPTGDDVLLMYKIKSRYPDGIKFLKHSDAIVKTNAKTTVGEFLEQRKRWASKKFSSLNGETKLTSIIVYIFSCSLVLLLLSSGFALVQSRAYLPFLGIGLILMLIKCLIDFLLLILTASFFNKKTYLYLFLPEQVIYIFYVLMVGMLAQKGKYEWKGRKITH